GEEGLRRQLPYLDARRTPHGRVGGDDRDLLLAPTFGRETLEQRVRVLGPAHLERPAPLVLSLAVEHEHAPCALCRHPAREQVAELLGRAELTGMQQVEAVEQVERRLRHLSAAVPRRGGAPPRR